MNRLIGFILIASTISFLFIGTSCQSIPIRSVKECEVLSDQQEATLCFVQVAKETKNAGICSKLDSGFKEECFFQVATAKGDESLCRKTYEEAECQKIVIKNVAQKTLNAGKCYQLVEKFDDYYEAADCVSFVAAEKKDEKLCEELAPGYGKVQEECFARLAMASNNILLCEKAIGSQLDDKCYQTLLNNNSDPVKLCQELEGLAFTYCVDNLDCEVNKNKEACADFVFKTRNDPNFCEHQLNTAKRTDCYTRVALERDSLELCLRTEVKPCITNLAIDKENPSICNLGIDYDADGNCYTNYALAFKDHQFCNRINDDFQKGECLKTFAIDTNNVNICYQISNVKRQECFWYFAKVSGNVSFCEFVGDLKEDCLGKVS